MAKKLRVVAGAVGQFDESVLAKYLKVAADAAAATATAETPFVCIPAAATILSVKYVPAAALTANASNFLTITVATRNGSGGAATTIKTLATSAGSWSAFTTLDFGSLSSSAVVAGGILTFAIAKSGTGVICPAGVLVVAYTLN